MTLLELYENKVPYTDAYNLSHQLLKENVDWEVSHLYNRKRGMILYGFNELVRMLMMFPITHDEIDKVDARFKSKGLDWTSREIFERVVNEFKGFAPIKIDAVPDGTWIPKNTPFAQVSNSVEGFGELVTWWEGYLLKASFPSGCATEAFHLRRYLEQNNLNKYKFHSFAWRSYNCVQCAYLGGTAWNLFLFGTDDVMTLMHSPNAPVTSIAALAHKVVQQYDKEEECYIHCIDVMREHYPDSKLPLLSMVIDTYDPYRFIEQYQQKIIDHALLRKVGVVFRPDSGDVFNQTVALLQNLEYLKQINMDQYNQFNVIIGEEMTPLKCMQYDQQFKFLGYDINKIVYGIGGGFHEHVTRKYMGHAMKTAYSNGRPRMKTSADIIKMSLPGVVMLELIDGNVVCRPIEFVDIEQKARTPKNSDGHKNLFRTVYINNEFGMNYTLKESWDDIHNRVNTIDFIAPLQEDIIYTKEMIERVNSTKEYIKNV